MHYLYETLISVNIYDHILKTYSLFIIELHFNNVSQDLLRFVYILDCKEDFVVNLYENTLIYFKCITYVVQMQIPNVTLPYMYLSKGYCIILK